MKTIKIFLACIALFSLSSFNMGGGYKVGDIATDFKLQNVDGKTVSLTDYKDAKGYIVIFTCNTCPYAQLYEDRIIKLHERYREMGFPVLAINPNDVIQKPGDNFEPLVDQKACCARYYRNGYYI